MPEEEFLRLVLADPTVAAVLERTPAPPGRPRTPSSGAARDLFAGLPVPIEIRNQARVHLWYGGHFGTAAPAPFRDCARAIDASAAVCCAVGVTVEDGRPRLYAPYGVDDLLGVVVRPNPGSPAPRAAYEAKAARWRSVWPELTVLPWA
jgi:hypothetical protein